MTKDPSAELVTARVDPGDEHILVWAKASDGSPVALARLAPAGPGKCRIQRLVVDSADPDIALALQLMPANIDLNLVNSGWDYALYHARSSAAEVYSSVHWAHFPNGVDASDPSVAWTVASANT